MPQIAFYRQAADEMRAAAADFEEGERGLGDVPRRSRGSLAQDSAVSSKIFIIAAGHLHRQPEYWQDQA
jgi:hypothetical protein